jgi:cytochrome b
MDGAAAHGARGPAVAGHTRDVRVWDPLVRLSHWTIAAAVVLNGLIVDAEAAAHLWIGYVALGVLGLRLLWGVVGIGAARLSAFPPSLSAARAHALGLLSGRASAHLSHNPLGALMVYNLWGTLGLVSATGIMMGSDTFFGVDWVEEVHGVLANWLLLSAVLHVAGVALDQRLTGVNLVRAMVTGTKRLPETRG